MYQYLIFKVILSEKGKLTTYMFSNSIFSKKKKNQIYKPKKRDSTTEQGLKGYS